MLTIIYGEDLVKSRNLLDQIKKENAGKEIINLDGKKTDLTGVKEVLESGAMFGSERFVILEDLTANRSKIIVEKIIEYLSLKQYSTDLVVWEKKDLTKSFLGKIKADKIFEFKPEAVLFKFLDSLRPNKQSFSTNNQNETLTLLHRCIKAERVEIIQYMIVGRIRHLILLKEKIEDMDEIKKMAPWQKGKLTKQANYFTLESLTDLYRKLLQIEVEQKSGTAVFDLEKALQLLIINL